MVEKVAPSFSTALIHIDITLFVINLSTSIHPCPSRDEITWRFLRDRLRHPANISDLFFY